MRGGFFASLLVISALTVDFECSRIHTMEIPLSKAVPIKVLSRNL